MHHHLRCTPATARSYLSERPRLDKREVGRSGTTAALKEKAGLLRALPLLCGAVLQLPKGVCLNVHL